MFYAVGGDYHLPLLFSFVGSFFFIESFFAVFSVFGGFTPRPR